MKFEFQNEHGQPVQIPIQPGDTVFVVGPNGCGKSSLMHKLYSDNRPNARRISAHRQTWFASNTVDLTPFGKKTTEQNMSARDSQADSRWLDHYPTQRASVTLFELVDSENARARKIAQQADADNIDGVRELAKKDAPLVQLNELLETANLPIEISIEDDQQLLASKNGGQAYSIAELSDGERNAVLIAASVLTAKPGTLIIIDEPERHLHRSISSPLLLSLFDRREDCAFVISTHDVSLPVDCPTADVLLIRSCCWSGKTASGWDTDLLTSGAEIGPEAKEAILGARRKVLFVEGESDSLDQQIYAILFPNVSVTPCGSCVDVERAVTGIRRSLSLHWVCAFGLIDRDNRDDQGVEGLRARGIYALEGYSVESLYYCSEIMVKVGERQSGVSNEIANTEAASQALLEHARSEKQRLCCRLIEKRVRAAIVRDLPTHESLLSTPVHTVTFDATRLIADEEARLDQLVGVGDVDSLVSRYPLHLTGALAKAAAKLGFQSRAKYESAVRKLVREDAESRRVLRAKLKSLTDAIEAPQ